MKRLIYQFHSWLGLVAGLGLLVIGLTGSALVFKAEIDGLVAPDLVKIPDPSKPRLDHDQFIATLQKNLPDYKVAGWGKPARPGYADVVYAVKPGEKEGKMFYVDGTNGLPRNPDVTKNETATDWLLELHYTFLADHTGTIIAGIFGLMLCLLGVTGVILYRKFWKTLFQLRWKKSARVLFSDTHKMVGISSTVFNLILGFTGAWWNLSHIIGHWMEDEPEPIVRTVDRTWADGISIEKLVAAAGAKVPGYQANWVSLPFEAGGDISMFGSVEGQGVLRSEYGSTVIFDGKTGELKSATTMAGAGIADQVLDAFRPLHYGTFGGLPVKILWSILALAPAILAITGALMWWKRKFR